MCDAGFTIEQREIASIFNTNDTGIRGGVFAQAEDAVRFHEQPSVRHVRVGHLVIDDVMFSIRTRRRVSKASLLHQESAAAAAGNEQEDRDCGKSAYRIRHYILQGNTSRGERG